MNQEITVWQGRFHNHIIYNEASLHRIREYVATNPARWREDTFFAESTSTPSNECPTRYVTAISVK